MSLDEEGRDALAGPRLRLGASTDGRCAADADALLAESGFGNEDCEATRCDTSGLLAALDRSALDHEADPVEVQ